MKLLIIMASKKRAPVVASSDEEVEEVEEEEEVEADTPKTTTELTPTVPIEIAWAQICAGTHEINVNWPDGRVVKSVQPDGIEYCTVYYTPVYGLVGKKGKKTNFRSSNMELYMMDPSRAKFKVKHTEISCRAGDPRIVADGEDSTNCEGELRTYISKKIASDVKKGKSTSIPKDKPMLSGWCKLSPASKPGDKSKPEPFRGGPICSYRFPDWAQLIDLGSAHVDSRSGLIVCNPLMYKSAPASVKDLCNIIKYKTVGTITWCMEVSFTQMGVSISSKVVSLAVLRGTGSSRGGLSMDDAIGSDALLSLPESVLAAAAAFKEEDDNDESRSVGSGADQPSTDDEDPGEQSKSVDKKQKTELKNSATAKLSKSSKEDESLKKAKKTKKKTEEERGEEEEEEQLPKKTKKKAEPEPEEPLKKTKKKAEQEPEEPPKKSKKKAEPEPEPEPEPEEQEEQEELSKKSSKKSKKMEEEQEEEPEEDPRKKLLKKTKLSHKKAIAVMEAAGASGVSDDD